jgi:proteasome-associated ATPase
MQKRRENASLQIAAKIAEYAAESDVRLHNYISALQAEIVKDARRVDELEELIKQFEEVYQRLTAPANRVGTFLQKLEEDKALVIVGDTEYVTFLDPQVDPEVFKCGVRVKLNEAFAVIGTLPSQPTGALQKIDDVLDDRRFRILSDVTGTQGRLVLRGHALEGASIKKGDEVRLDPSGRVALEHFAKQEAKDYFMEEIPEVGWSQIGGQEHAIRVIRETLELPLLYPEIYSRFDKKPVKGILLYGPPGCGKTLIGKAVANNLAKQYSEKVGHKVKEYFMHISGPKILNMWLGETERMVREIFQTAREKAKEGFLVVVFIDEADSILRTRSGGRWLNISNTVVPQFCAEMDGMVSLENIVLILTSNRPDYIDPAIIRPERIDRKVKVSRPDKNAAREILSIYLHENLPIDQELLQEYDNQVSCARKALIEGTLNTLWTMSPDTEFLRTYLRNGSSEILYWKDLVSGALLKSVVDRAKDYAIRRSIENPEIEHGISLVDLQTALKAEYQENEIFPKSDAVEDWLSLLDRDPEDIVNVRPIYQRVYPDISGDII